ncbi:MAG: IS110 family transposase [Spirochaetaceae bacterium]|nr:MAG: IS110 family transposase [Spirochaetaceae bacterium]
MKNRIHATLAKHAIRYEQSSDLFGKSGREFLEKTSGALPEQTRFSLLELLSELDLVSGKIATFETRMQEVFAESEEVRLLRSIPGIGFILAVVIASEIGDVSRFPSSAHFASYAGTTPRVHASGGKVRYGQVRSDVNRYLKWGFAEAANTICQLRRRWTGRHVSELYNRVKLRRGHQTAIGAVSRHLAESVYWVLRKREPYREPKGSAYSVSSTKG